MVNAGTLVRPWTPLIGREREVAEVVGAIQDGARLVVLVGLGGIGKTRVALTAAAQLEAQREVRHIDAVALQRGRDLALALEHALGPTAAGVLVIDNFEQLLPEGTRVVAERLSRDPALQIIVTSRLPLQWPGEQVLRIGPVATSGPDSAAAQILKSRLYGEATASWRNDPAALARLATRLDGVPLALELAAARAHLVTPDELVSALVARAGGTDLPEHGWLDAALGWTWERLAERDRAALIDWAVIEGPFDFALLSSLSHARTDQALASLDALVASSLVLIESAPAAGANRYRILETVRRFAMAHADEGQLERARLAFGDAVLASLRAVAGVGRFAPLVPPTAEHQRGYLLTLLRRAVERREVESLRQGLAAARLMMHGLPGATYGSTLVEQVAELVLRPEAEQLPLDLRVGAGLRMLGWAAQCNHFELGAQIADTLERWAKLADDLEATIAVQAVRLMLPMYAWDFAAAAAATPGLLAEPRLEDNMMAYSLTIDTHVIARRGLGRATLAEDEPLLVRKGERARVAGNEIAYCATLSNHAYLLTQLGQPERALALAQTAEAGFLRVDAPRFANLARREKARAQVELGRTGEALASYDRVVAGYGRSPERYEMVLERAATLLEVGRYEEVARDLADVPASDEPNVFVRGYRHGLATALAALRGEAFHAATPPATNTIEDLAFAALRTIGSERAEAAVVAATAMAPHSTRIRGALRVAAAALELATGGLGAIGAALDEPRYRVGPRWVDLANKPLLATLLELLVTARLAHEVPTKAALAAGLWPDERLPEATRDMRLHAAVRALRQSGFDVISASEGGFALDRPVLRVDPRAWPGRSSDAKARGRGRPRKGGHDG